jgi:phospholipase C
MKRLTLWLFAALGASITACSGRPAAVADISPAAFVPAVAQHSTTTPIRHVIIVIQENRSFDNFFATYGHGSVGATRGLTHTGASIPLTATTLAGADLDHLHGDFLIEYDGGKMDGFDRIGYGNPTQRAGTIPYQYVKPTHIAPYWRIADQFVLADHMFQTQGSGSFTAHQDLIAGGTRISEQSAIVDLPSTHPWGCDAPAGTKTSLISRTDVVDYGGGPFPCFTYATLADLLNAKSISWKYYTPPLDDYGGIWNAFDSSRAVRYSTQWQTNISIPQTNVLSDIAKSTLPAVSWVVPDGNDSDHPGASANTGPSWVASIVNAVGQNPKIWKSTAIVVVWDDWGGFYDNVPPPHEYGFGSLGFRVPCLIVSPYARAGSAKGRTGYVSHTIYEFGSILRFVEDNWGLGRLGTSDVRANSIADSFDFTQAPRAFKVIPAPFSRAYFEHEVPSHKPVDDQ